ncbi:MAG: nodulation protein NfeD [Deltaproteobacteria bacterium]|nr:nodulation protein NfeD [Deltaproteobacteria bacterium]
MKLMILANLRKIIGIALCLLLLFFGGSLLAKEKSAAVNAPSKIVMLNVAEVITPPTAELVQEGIKVAIEEQAQALVIVLDTPGGLDLAMRDVVKAILNAPVPVVVFVGPSGARAASAGAIIAVSAHLVAMAPSTNIGSAHPVNMGIGATGGDDILIQKARNDMVAYAQSIAKMRGKNEKWIKAAIVNSSSITETVAKESGVIDFIANDVNDLLKKIDGTVVSMGTSQVTIDTRNVEIVTLNAGIRHNLLSAISNPNIAYILFLIGLAGIYFEFASPGAIFPGVIGAIALLLALFSMQTLPVSLAAIALILLSLVLFFMETQVVSNGILIMGGIVSLIIGSLMFFDSAEPALQVSLIVLITTLLSIIIFFIAVIRLAIKAQGRKKLNGSDALLGNEGIALEAFVKTGTVLINGEYWQASNAGDGEIPAKAVVTVVDVVGLRLVVKIKQ